MDVAFRKCNMIYHYTKYIALHVHLNQRKSSFESNVTIPKECREWQYHFVYAKNRKQCNKEKKSKAKANKFSESELSDHIHPLHSWMHWHWNTNMFQASFQWVPNAFMMFAIVCELYCIFSCTYMSHVHTRTKLCLAHAQTEELRLWV